MTITKNLLWQFSGQGVGKLFMLLFYVLLPTVIGVEEYGKFSFALAVVSIIIQPTVEMGLDMAIVKWVSRGYSAVVKKALLIRTAAAIVGMIILLIVSTLLHVDRSTAFVLFMYFATVSFQNVVFSYFRGIENMKLEGLINPLQKVATVALFFILSALGINNAHVGTIALLGSALMGIMMLFFMSSDQLPAIIYRRVDLGVPGYSELLKEGAVLGGVVFLWMIYFRIDSVMLGAIKGNIEVGTYNIAYKIMEGFFFIPAMVMMVFFPKLAKPDSFRKTFKKLLLILGTIGLAGSIFLYVSTPSVIHLIYKGNFLGSIPVLRVLSLVLVPVFLGHLVTQSLVALDMNKVYLIVASFGALINIALNYLLIPSYGAIGSAWATLATELMVVLCCGYFVWAKSPDVFKLMPLDFAGENVLIRGKKE